MSHIAGICCTHARNGLALPLPDDQPHGREDRAPRQGTFGLAFLYQGYANDDKDAPRQHPRFLPAAGQEVDRRGRQPAA